MGLALHFGGSSHLHSHGLSGHSHVHDRDDDRTRIVNHDHDESLESSIQVRCLLNRVVKIN